MDRITQLRQEVEAGIERADARLGTAEPTASLRLKTTPRNGGRAFSVHTGRLPWNAAAVANFDY